MTGVANGLDMSTGGKEGIKDDPWVSGLMNLVEGGDIGGRRCLG